jgi:glycopeptide antibiotics resistance protein
LRPFDYTLDASRFTADSEDLPLYGLRRMSLVPLADYYWGNKYQALDGFLRKSLSFVPLGVLWACAHRDPYRFRTTGSLVLVALLLAAGIEFGRYFMPSHSASIADVLIQCGGAWLGFCIGRHVRAVLWSETLLRGWNKGTRCEGFT